MSTLAGPADGGPGFSRHRLGRPDHPTTHDASIESKYLVIKPDPTFRLGLDIVLTRMLNNANIAGGEARSKGKGGQVSISLGGRGEPTPL